MLLLPHAAAVEVVKIAFTDLREKCTFVLSSGGDCYTYLLRTTTNTHNQCLGSCHYVYVMQFQHELVGQQISS